MDIAEMDDSVRDILEAASISASLTEHIIEASRGGRYNPPPLRVNSLPPINGRNIISFTADSSTALTIASDAILRSLEGLGLTAEQARFLLRASGIQLPADAQATVTLSHRQLAGLGIHFLPLVSFGLLNGGSASSYFDQKKNREFSPVFFSHLAPLVEKYAGIWSSRPKGVSPAFLVPHGGPQADYSFLELKLRGWLLLLRNYQRASRSLPFQLPWEGMEKVMPCFQMVNRVLADDIDRTIRSYRGSALLANLVRETGIDICGVETGIQDLVAAFTPPATDGRRDIFLDAWGKPGTPLGMPGGHGQNFKVLEPIYRALRDSGKRWAYLGNIDNLGYLPDPAAVAAIALGGQQAAFEFSFKTRMDRKGGILVVTPDRRLTCGDIGQAVPHELIAATEAQKSPILFNCATGLFDLDWLVPNLESIQRDLPIRFSNQDKDAGRYSQAEQTTWEIIGLIEQPLILAVEKKERFLAAKFFLDCLLTSGFARELVAADESDKELQVTGNILNEGLSALLVGKYGLHLEGTRWIPID
jgi:hypothetical protein